MSVTEEMLLTIRQIQESLKSDMTDIMQGENANSFEAYWEILKQLQQILQKSIIFTSRGLQMLITTPFERVIIFTI